jgi:hypothetical protein
MSFSIRTTIALAAFSVLAAAQTVAPKLDAPCADAVIFMSRGNDAPYHDGRTFPFVEATCGKLTAQGKTCDYIDIQFDNTLGGDYCNQVAEGARNGLRQITAFQAKCPCTHIILNGYSEGAHVAGDVLGGPGGCTFVSTGIDSASPAGKAIAAALLWGDVLHTANQPYNVLDGASKQKNPRSPDDLARLNRYSSVLRSYCAAGDPVCAGGNVVAQHLNYFELYTDEASTWAVGKVAAAAPLCAAPSSSSAPASSSTAPASSVIATGASSVVVSAVSSVSAAASAVSSAVASAVFSSATASVVSSAAAIYPNSTSAAVIPAPFPTPIAYDSCVVVYKVEYKYV